MEKLTKNEFLSVLAEAQEVKMLFGGYVSANKFWTPELPDMLRRAAAVCDDSRRAERVTESRLEWRLADGTRSVLAYDQQTEGRSHYRIGDIYIREERTDNYLPNYCVYQIIK